MLNKIIFMWNGEFLFRAQKKKKMLIWTTSVAESGTRSFIYHLCFNEIQFPFNPKDRLSLNAHRNLQWAINIDNKSSTR